LFVGWLAVPVSAKVKISDHHKITKLLNLGILLFLKCFFSTICLLKSSCFCWNTGRRALSTPCNHQSQTWPSPSWHPSFVGHHVACPAMSFWPAFFVSPSGVHSDCRRLLHLPVLQRYFPKCVHLQVVRLGSLSCSFCCYVLNCHRQKTTHAENMQIRGKQQQFYNSPSHTSLRWGTFPVSTKSSLFWQRSVCCTVSVFKTAIFTETSRYIHLHYSDCFRSFLFYF